MKVIMAQIEEGLLSRNLSGGIQKSHGNLSWTTSPSRDINPNLPKTKQKCQPLTVTFSDVTATKNSQNFVTGLHITQLNTTCIVMPYLSKMNFKIIQPWLRSSQKSSIPSDFPVKMLCVFLFSPIPSSAHLILLTYKNNRSTWLCNILHSPAAFSLSDSKSMCYVKPQREASLLQLPLGCLLSFCPPCKRRVGKQAAAETILSQM